MDQPKAEEARELAALLDVARSVASTLELKPLLNIILDKLKLVTDYAGAGIAIFDGDHLNFLESRGPGSAGREPQIIGVPLSLEHAGPLMERWRRQEPVIIDDVRADDDVSRAFQRVRDVRLSVPPTGYIRSFLGVPLVHRDQLIGLLTLSHDTPGAFTPHHAHLAMAIATHAAAAIENARLYERERHTAEQLATLVDVSRTIASTLELQPLLGQILDQLKLVLDYTSAAVVTSEGDRYLTREYRGPLPRDVVLPRPLRIDLTAPTSLAAARGETTIIADIWEETPEARAYRATLGEEYLRTTAAYIRCVLNAPMLYKGAIVGSLVITHETPGYYDERAAELALTFARQAAVAIANARLYEQARAAQAGLTRQVERLGVLSGITRQLLAATELDTVIAVVAESAMRLCETAGAAVGLIQNDGKKIVFAATAGEPQDYFEMYAPATIDDAFLAGTAAGQALVRREAVVVEDYAAWGDPAAPHEQRTATVAHGLRAFIVAPLLVDGVPIGLLRVHDLAPRTFAPEDVTLIQALADHAALAIEHARLLRQGHEAAVLEERTRLARELHDSVTQSIFSLGMLAQAARTQHVRAPDRLGPTLERVSALAQEALIEMRSLLYELQPAALTEQGLASALDRLVGAMRMRGDLTLTYTAGTTARLDANTELALFRIAQEALANVIKHAHATDVAITLSEAVGHLILSVTDNGDGFDPAVPATPSEDGSRGGMGLRSMRERAESAGIALAVQSAPAAGTTVTASVPLPGR